ncbi:MAG: adenosylcobinamide-phosphate synthase CbiB [bacterium]|nr:adenosylcobinamide-phosphate synthase CbiB [bacterium]
MIDVLLGYIADLIFGDPYWFPHPVRAIGIFISSFEKYLRRIFISPKGEKIAGFILAGTTVLLSYLSVWLILRVSLSLNIFLFHVLNIIFIYTTLATKCLGDEAKKIYRLLKSSDLDNARKVLSYIVGRDTEDLDIKEICRAVIETVAENTSDGIIAPLFYLFIGGTPLAMAYKAINTLDSMVGYKNERYINIGMASARLDDIANFLPSRITALLMIVASIFLRLNFRRGFLIIIRDGYKNPSPNSGYPEASMAGILGIQLGGLNSYGGRIVEKPYIGDPIYRINPEHILASIKVMYGTSILGFTLGFLVRYLV